MHVGVVRQSSDVVLSENMRWMWFAPDAGFVAAQRVDLVDNLGEQDAMRLMAAFVLLSRAAERETLIAQELQVAAGRAAHLADDGAPGIPSILRWRLNSGC